MNILLFIEMYVQPTCTQLMFLYPNKCILIFFLLHLQYICVCEHILRRIKNMSYITEVGLMLKRMTSKKKKKEIKLNIEKNNAGEQVIFEQKTTNTIYELMDK